MILVQLSSPDLFTLAMYTITLVVVMIFYEADENMINRMVAVISIRRACGADDDDCTWRKILISSPARQI